jgi:hypothetical protein
MLKGCSKKPLSVLIDVTRSNRSYFSWGDELRSLMKVLNRVVRISLCNSLEEGIAQHGQNSGNMSVQSVSAVNGFRGTV